jgi:hypothetical protein
MGPVGEVLCAAMAAWGAKYSGSPVVLGLAGGECEIRKSQSCSGNGIMLMSDAFHSERFKGRPRSKFRRIYPNFHFTIITECRYPIWQISPFRLIPGGPERLQWADAREPVCKALQTRAEQMLDERGLLRNPTIDGLATIIAIFKLYGQRNPGEEMTREEYLRGEEISGTHTG